MKINIDLNIKNQKWSGIEKHVDRKHENYSNQNIRQDMSKDNINLSSQYNANQVIYNHYAPYIKKHDDLIHQGKSRAKPYKSVQGYLKRRRACPETTWVIKAGSEQSNEAVLNQIIQAYGKDNADEAKGLKTKADNMALSLYSKGFNTRNSQLIWTNAETNVDETSPHIHARVVPLGYTKSKRFGKTPSASMTKALEIQYHVNNHRVAIHQLHAHEDPIMVKCMNEAYQRVFHVNFNFKLSRSHNGYYGLGEKEYETLKKHEDAVKKELTREKRSLIGTNTKLISQNKELKARVYHYSQGTLLKPSEIEPIEQSVDSLIKQNAKLKRQLSSLYQVISEKNTAIKKLQSQVSGNQALIQNMTNELKPLEDTNNTLEKKLFEIHNKNRDLYQEWLNSRRNLAILDGISHLSPRLQQALIDLSNGSEASLTEYLTELIESERSTNGSEPNGQSPSQRY